MDNKKIITICIITCSLIVGGIVLLLSSGFQKEPIQKVNQTDAIVIVENEATDDTVKTEEDEVQELINEEMLNVGDVGDVGSDTYHTIDVYYAIEDNGKSKYEILRDLAIEYNKSIPFLEDGEWYELGYTKQDKFTYELYDMCPLGMDSQNYLRWLFLNVFGYVPEELKKNIVASYLQSDNQITLSEVCIGDIGLLNTSIEGENHYGVCVGFDADYGIPIFSHMSNVKNDGFVEGNNKLSYILMEDRMYLGDSAPVEFNYFFRLKELEWE